MIKIAHRGNTIGIDVERENTPAHIDHALSLGYFVETDVWYISGDFFLGHDEPLHIISLSKLKHPKIICHAKSADTLLELLRHPEIHCFWHQSDEYTLTSKNWVWEVWKDDGCRVFDNGQLIGICSDRFEQ